MSLQPGPRNLLLHAASAIGPDLTRQLQHVFFEAGHQFSLAGKPVRFLVFPLRGIISLRLGPQERLTEVGLFGREGFGGVPLFLGMRDEVLTSVALTQGEAIVMPPQVFETYLLNGAFRQAVERFVHLLITILGNISHCNRVHDIEDIFIGRLLLIQDRLRTDSFELTQESFSRVLGVRRASLNAVATGLRDDGLIDYSRRGRLAIVDRRQLEKRSCSCYRAMKARFDRLVRALV